VNGYHTSTFEWPWPVAVNIDLRLGTHVIEAKLEAELDSGIGLHWQARSPTSRVTFDLVAAASPAPSLAAPNCSVLADQFATSAFMSGSPIHPSVHRSVHSADLAYRCSTNGNSPISVKGQEELRRVRVVLVGSLHIAGQNLLALEQAARLPYICAGGNSKKNQIHRGSQKLRDGIRTDLDSEEVGDEEKQIVGFAVSYLTSASRDGPLVPLLASAGVPLGRFELLITTDAIDVLAAAYATLEELASFNDTEGDFNGVPPAQPEEAVVVAWLVAALAEGETGKEGSDLAAPVYRAVASLLSQLRGVHVLSFTNHETMVVHDRVGGS